MVNKDFEFLYEKEILPKALCGNERPRTGVINEEEAIKVKLVSYTNNIYDMVFDAAMSCFGNTLDKHGKATQEEKERVLEEVLKGRMLPNMLEGIVFTFEVEGMSKILHNQLVRHRAGICYASVTSGNFSQRHTDFVCPPNVESSQFYDEYKDVVFRAMSLYVKMENAGIPIEDARNILPMSIVNQTMVFVNYRTLRDMIAQRWCDSGQPLGWTILCKKLKEEVNKVYPILAKYLMRGCDKTKECRYPFDRTWSKYNQYKPCGRHPLVGETSGDEFLYDLTPQQGRKLSIDYTKEG